MTTAHFTAFCSVLSKTPGALKVKYKFYASFCKRTNEPYFLLYLKVWQQQQFNGLSMYCLPSLLLLLRMKPWLLASTGKLIREISATGRTACRQFSHFCFGNGVQYQADKSLQKKSRTNFSAVSVSGRGNTFASRTATLTNTERKTTAPKRPSKRSSSVFSVCVCVDAHIAPVLLIHWPSPPIIRH